MWALVGAVTPPPIPFRSSTGFTTFAFPDPSDEGVRNALRPFLDNAAAAAELDVQIALTDGLIDQIAYRLYGLSEEQVEVEEV